FDAEIAGSESDVQIGLRRNLDYDLEVAVAGSIRRDLGVEVVHVRAHPDFGELIGVAHAPLNPDAVVRAARDSVVAGRQIHSDRAAGEKRPLEGVRRSSLLGGPRCRRRDDCRSEDRRYNQNSHNAAPPALSVLETKPARAWFNACRASGRSAGPIQLAVEPKVLPEDQLGDIEDLPVVDAEMLDDLVYGV